MTNQALNVCALGGLHTAKRDSIAPNRRCLRDSEILTWEEQSSWVRRFRRIPTDTTPDARRRATRSCHVHQADRRRSSLIRIADVASTTSIWLKGTRRHHRLLDARAASQCSPETAISVESTPRAKVAETTSALLAGVLRLSYARDSRFLTSSYLATCNNLHLQRSLWQVAVLADGQVAVDPWCTTVVDLQM